jgi:6-pyruvoyltetrahydropterin/6-carboxytetrahydropterin synthase
VVVKVESAVVNDIGMAYDFVELKQHLGGILARFDHTCLNDIPPFDTINPSSENIATTIYSELQSKLVAAPVSLSCVEVWESPQSGVAYSPD